MIWGSGWSKSRLPKAAGAEPAGQMRDEKVHAVVARSTFPSQNVQNTPGSDHFLEVEMSKKCTPLWREAHFQVKMYKAPHVRATFGSSDVEKVHAVLARSTFRSQNVQNTTCSRHFWRFGCWKSARRCGAKHLSKSKCTKHHMFAPLLEVRMLKKCTPLWREAHFEVKMYKALHVRATFGGSDVEKVYAVVARSTFRSKHVQNTRGSDHFWRFRCRFASIHYSTGRYTTLHYTTFHYTTLHDTTPQVHNYTPLHSTTLNYTTLHYTTLHSTTLHYITIHCATFRYTSLHYTTLHYTTTTTTQRHSTTIHTTTLHYTKLHYTTLHSTTLHYITLHYLPLHFTTLHYTTLQYSTTTSTTTQVHSTTRNYSTLHYTTLHYTPLHSTTLHYTTLHYTTLHYTEWHCTADRQVDR